MFAPGESDPENAGSHPIGLRLRVTLFDKYSEGKVSKKSLKHLYIKAPKVAVS